MTTLIDRVADLLYPDAGETTADIKFYCAGEIPTKAEELAEIVHIALLAVESGEAREVTDFAGY